MGVSVINSLSLHPLCLCETERESIAQHMKQLVTLTECCCFRFEKNYDLLERSIEQNVSECFDWLIFLPDV